ncbi:MAG: type IV pilus modification protein PilV [Burkholderiales bacterium]|nr:type IV pilus modification protein PilV [Burkholderiales bacterium]
MNAQVSNARRQRGALLIEVLVSIVICAFGLLGFAALQARATAAEFESYQRSQALVLLSDMTDRMNANRGNAGSYVVSGLIGEGAAADCASLAGASLDLCEWGNLIRGSAETRGGSKVGSMLSARGCIARAVGTSDRYVISVVWQGTVATGAPANGCGQGDSAFPREDQRRAVSSTVCIARLKDPDVIPPTPRC